MDFLLTMSVIALAIALYLVRNLIAENSELKQQALTDVLTGCPNRRAFDIALDKAISKIDREGKGRFVAWFDLDKFKPINDVYGHEAGDKALQHFASKMREADLLCRVGGDEFALVAEGDIELFRLRMRAMQERGLTFNYKGDPLTFSFSYGVQAIDTGIDADELLNSVDQSMFENKTIRSAGR